MQSSRAFSDIIKENKIIVVDNKNLIFLDKFKDLDYVIFSMVEFVNYLMDQVCEIICTDVRSSIINKFQRAEFIRFIESYFGKFCLEKHIIAKFADKKIVIIEPITEKSVKFFLNLGFNSF